ncbi:MAG: DUF5701 family protein [Patescibacteria group bacterium]|jgi:hypothetical protein
MNKKSHAVDWGSEPPTFAQLKEFFAQIEHEQVTQGIMQDILRHKIGVTPEDIRNIWLFRFFMLGYPEAIGMNYKEFAKIVPYPEDKPGKLLVVKHELVSIDKQMELIGGKNRIDLSHLTNVVKVPLELIYWRYGVEDGGKMLNHSPHACIKIFEEEDRVSTVVEEGIAICIQNPKVLEDHCIDLSGSKYGYINVPCLGLEKGIPYLDSCSLQDANIERGSASCRKS